MKKCEEQDGYRLAHAQYMTDHSDHSEESVRELLNLAKEVEEKLDTFLQRVGQRSGRRESAILNALTRSAGKKPTLPSEPSNESILSWCEDLSFYAGTLLGQHFLRQHSGELLLVDPLPIHEGPRDCCPSW